MRSHVEIEPRQHRKQRGVFIRILEALYHSRRCAAKREFRHYRHFIVEDAQAEAPLESRHAEKSSRSSRESDTPANRRVCRDTGTQFV
jgi:hypothetical protein